MGQESGESSAEHVLVDTRDFGEHFNHSSFSFRHSLAHHPLFTLPRLAELAETILTRGNPRNFTHYVASDIDAGTRLPSREPGARVAHAVARIGESGSWIKLTSAQDVDPEYRRLTDRVLEEIEDRTRVAIRREMTWLGATIFVASPGTITPYHIDHTPNFLLQIQGTKQVNVFDQTDRSVLTEEEIERFYIGDEGAACYRESSQAKANVYDLLAGDGVHHPGLAPHWVKNGSEISVALSVAFCLRSLDRLAGVYQANHYLRRLGRRPAPLGQSPWIDALKIHAFGALSAREPRNYRETIYSAVDRLHAPLELAAMWRRRVGLVKS